MLKRTCYTDGACSGNVAVGGWSFVELTTSQDCEFVEIRTHSGAKTGTTNNEMELTGAFKALVKAYKDKLKKVTICCDSAYVVNAVEKEWLLNWQKNGWKTKEDKQIKNIEIWKRMYKLIYEKGLVVSFIKVKGHDGNLLNEMADVLAVKAKKKLMGE